MDKRIVALLFGIGLAFVVVIVGCGSSVPATKAAKAAKAAKAKQPAQKPEPQQAAKGSQKLAEDAKQRDAERERIQEGLNRLPVNVNVNVNVNNQIGQVGGEALGRQKGKQVEQAGYGEMGRNLTLATMPSKRYVGHIKVADRWTSKGMVLGKTRSIELTWKEQDEQGFVTAEIRDPVSQQKRVFAGKLNPDAGRNEYQVVLSPQDEGDKTIMFLPLLTEVPDPIGDIFYRAHWKEGEVLGLRLTNGCLEGRALTTKYGLAQTRQLEVSLHPEFSSAAGSAKEPKPIKEKPSKMDGKLRE